MAEGKTSYQNTVSFNWSSDEPFKTTIAVLGPNTYGRTPTGSAELQYFDPYSGQVITRTVPVGGYAPTYIDIVISD